ncbi:MULTISPECIES: hypothetical protein [unclassified Sphingopyxis]|uniref:hypothetical protein n=1 Tax=unclassified Sphingopyxis TaxID=2614943 RepID=UPI0008BAC25F|nr:MULTISPECIES: hypothetical protein [unclassified Sphingopyxis]MDR7061669.1 hypothetical protein [Sphingopyxis sp. BE235]MDR7182386.1 hypothetical protein [Sphingopyxis sp. BE249]OHD08750.1 MAG: hypothetical protein A3E77_01830 [Sphingopyxis sp. RIFCSPHIGHO2_12_FULL_65_19]
MADRVSISFKLGGHLTPETWLALAAVIAGESLSIEWDGPAFESSHRTVGEPLELFANEVAWGKVEPLETFCQDHGLPYRFWAGGFFAEWSAERIVFRGEGTPDSFIVDESDRVLIDRHEVVRRGSVEGILAYFDEAEFTVPTLVVEGDPDIPVGAAGQETAHG